MLEMASCIDLSCVVLVDGDKRVIFCLAMSHSVGATLALAGLVGVQYDLNKSLLIDIL
jgi:hypothetical protein